MADSKQPMDKNKIAIGILSIIILIVLVIVIGNRLSNNSNANKSGGSNSKVSNEKVYVNQESGNQDSTISAKINFRNINFSMTMKQVKKMENKLDDTLSNPTISSSDDGYTYITYEFNEKNAPALFGAQANATDKNACLSYIFTGKKLSEVRMQYGILESSAFDTMCANITNQYGNSTYSRTYSNGTKEFWWKSGSTTLNVIYQKSGVIAYYRANKK